MRDLAGGSDQGAVYVYRNTGFETWEGPTEIVAPTPAAGARFGSSIALGQNLAAIGAPNTITNTGRIYIYARTVNTWAHVKTLEAPASDGTPYFGFEVALDGDNLVVGAPAGASPSSTPANGRAYVFSRNEGGTDAWGLSATLTPSVPNDHDLFGFAIAINGNRIVVGAPNRASGATIQAGAAVVFEREGAAWMQRAMLQVSTGGKFGSSLALSGQYLAVGAPADGVGKVYLYTVPTWGDKPTPLTHTDGVAGYSFGTSIALGQNFLAVGASTEAPVTGVKNRVYLYTRLGKPVNPQNPATLEEPTLLTVVDGTGYGYFGEDVSLSSDWLVTGAPQSTLANNAAVYVNTLAASPFLPYPDGYSGPSGHSGYHLLTEAEMVRLFGLSCVCATYGPSGTCLDLKATAKEWRDWVARANLSDGNFGMGVSSLDFSAKPALLDNYRWTTRTTWSLLYDESLSADLIQYTYRQFIAPVRSSIAAGYNLSLAEVVERLQTNLGDPVTISSNLMLIKPSWDASQGIVLVPHAISRIPASDSILYRVWVYDPFLPGKEDTPTKRYIDLDITTDSWVLDASGYPMYSSYPWEGNSDTLGLVTLEEVTAVPTCNLNVPTGLAANLAAAPEGTIWVQSAGDALITDGQGRQIGDRAGSFVNEIPGAYLSPVYGGLGSATPMRIFTVPLTTGLSVALSGQTAPGLAAATAPQGVAMFGPGYATELTDMSSTGAISFSADGDQISYTAGSGDAPALRFARADNIIMLDAASIAAGQTMTATLDPASGEIRFRHTAASAGTYNLYVELVDERGLHIFTHEGLTITSGATHIVSYGAWDGSSEITLKIDANSNGSIDQSMNLENTALRRFLPLIVR